MNIRSSADKVLYFLGLGLLAAAVLFYFLVTRVGLFRHMPCLFHALTGFYCPGCGATRSFYLLLHGQLLSSLEYYPAVPYCAAVYGWFMLSNTAELLSGGRLKIGLSYRNIYLYLALALILGNFLVKNLLLLLS